jgi:excisionase family DNA binding protein
MGLATLFTVGELSTYLHVHESTIYRLVEERKLPAFKIGSNWRFRREQIDTWRLAQETNPSLRNEAPAVRATV